MHGEKNGAGLIFETLAGGFSPETGELVVLHVFVVGVHKMSEVEWR